MEVKKLAEEKVVAKLQTLNLKKDGNNALIGWGAMVLAFLIIGISVVMVVTGQNRALWIGFGVLLVTPAIITGIVFLLRSTKISNHNQSVLLACGAELHRIFFENSPQPFAKIQLKFEGIWASQVFSKHAFHFKIGSEKIVWDIDEDVEIRVRTYRDANGRTVTQTYKVYLLKYSLVTSAQKLTGISEIMISGGKTPRKKENYFQSESIAFNSRFKVRFLDQLEVYKLFTPKIIENFTLEKADFLKKDTIVLTDKKAYIKRRDSYEALKSWVPDALDYSKIRWSEKKIFSDIVKKIALDFDRYYQIQALLQPLELYDQTS